MSCYFNQNRAFYAHPARSALLDFLNIGFKRVIRVSVVVRGSLFVDRRSQGHAIRLCKWQRFGLWQWPLLRLPQPDMLKIVFMTSACSMTLMIFIAPLHFGQVSGSISYIFCISRAHSLRFDGEALSDLTLWSLFRFWIDR